MLQYHVSSVTYFTLFTTLLHFNMILVHLETTPCEVENDHSVVHSKSTRLPLKVNASHKPFAVPSKMVHIPNKEHFIDRQVLFHENLSFNKTTPKTKHKHILAVYCND